MHISEIRESKYLKKEEVGNGLVLTIDSLEQKNLAKENEPEEWKYVLNFQDCDKPLVLNSTNAQIIAMITGSEETDEWTGHQIELYHDKTIAFGGRLVGGIRVRAPGSAQAPIKRASPKSGPLKHPAGPPRQQQQQQQPNRQPAAGRYIPQDEPNPFD